MNAITTPMEPPLDWDAASQQVSAWRGSMLQYFGSAEAGVSKTLARVAACGERGLRVRLRHLVGQRFQDLQDALDPDGPFGVEGASAAVALRAFRDLEHVRTILSHGSARIALDRKGRWMVEFRFATFRGRGLERQAHLFEQEAAEGLSKEVRRLSNRLCSKLQTLRHALQDDDDPPCAIGAASFSN